MKKSESIIILDFGSQYSQLIARRIRELNIYSKIYPHYTPIEELKKENANAIILSGGPSSVFAKNAPDIQKEIFSLGIPILGICYGLQLIVKKLHGKVSSSQASEYGRAHLHITWKNPLFNGINQDDIYVWMSHGDKVQTLPAGFISLGETNNTEFAAIGDLKNNIYGIQFHPEVSHTEKGLTVLSNFCKIVAGVKDNWTMKHYAEKSIEEIKEHVGNNKVILGLSGGVDSTVTAALINKAIGNRLTCIFINNGLLRKNEPERVKKLFTENLKIKLKYIDAEERFLDKLKNIEDPEQKRKIIGNEFIKVFEENASEIEGVKFLAQGTTYPDVIESVPISGNASAMIKSHHNVGGLPEKMKLHLLEPLRSLFKDEVRILGDELGLPKELVYRQPFPGPGLAIRIIGSVTKNKLKVLREADKIFIDEMKKAGYYYKIWQSFAVLLPINTVGVMGDERTYEKVIALRAVNSNEGMTADWVYLPNKLLETVSNKIVNEVQGVNRVVFDLTSKPPSTIEWE